MEEALYKGNSHDNGGIKVLVDGTKPIEVEGHEYLLCNKAMQSTKIFEFKNKTNKQILDEFHAYSTCEFKQNEAHSGDFIICKKVVLDTNKRNITGTIKEVVNIMQSEKGCRQSNDDVFKTGGEIDQKEVEKALNKGIKIESEHIDTAKKLYEHEITPKQAAESIAKEHLAESPQYYNELEKMETKLQNKKEIDYSKLDPLKIEDLEFVETFKSADNNTKIIKFIWDGDFYEWKYSSTGSGGGIHIYKYNSLQALKKPLTTSGTHETIYNTWNSYQTTLEGRFIEFSIMKINKDDIFGYGNNNLTTTSVSIKVEDYKNEFQINKAIEKLIDYKGANRNDYNAEEINFISYYSGYGGLGKYGTVGRELAKGLKYEYYTPDEIVKKMWGLAYKYGYGTLGDNSIFETSAGIGNFVKYAPKDVKVVCNEINKYSVKILEILYPDATIYHKYFEQNFITKDNKSMKSKIDNLDKYSLIIGNPPYGELTGKYIGMGEDAYTKAGNFCEYFITRSLDLLVQDGLLIYIVGAEQLNGGTLFLDSKMSKVKEIIFDKAHLIDAYRLPVKVFERTGVSSEILIFRKK